MCPNLHAFCSFCIETWLEKSKHCPTCRISINKENPCRRILGSIDNFDEVDLLKPSDFSHSSVRKARFFNMFEQYEEEINRLNKHIDSLNVDITKLKVKKCFFSSEKYFFKISNHWVPFQLWIEKIFYPFFNNMFQRNIY